jgi:hypothetical protein
MLRITQSADACGTRIFVLEGKLAGEWVQELIHTTDELTSGDTINLEAVSYVDALGEEALRALSQRGASFVAENAYGKDLCRRLHLHRLCSARLRKIATAHHC